MSNLYTFEDTLGDLFEKYRDHSDITTLMEDDISVWGLVKLAIEDRCIHRKYTKEFKHHAFKDHGLLEIMHDLKTNPEQCRSFKPFKKIKQDLEKYCEAEISTAMTKALKELDHTYFEELGRTIRAIKHEDPETKSPSQINTCVARGFLSFIENHSRLPTIAEWKQVAQDEVLNSDPEGNKDLDPQEWNRAMKLFSMDRLHNGEDRRGRKKDSF